MRASKKCGKPSVITSARKAQKTFNALTHLINQLFLKAAELYNFKMSEIFLVISDKWPKFLSEKKTKRVAHQLNCEEAAHPCCRSSVSFNQ